MIYKNLNHPCFIVRGAVGGSKFKHVCFCALCFCGLVGMRFPYFFCRALFLFSFLLIYLFDFLASLLIS